MRPEQKKRTTTRLRFLSNVAAIALPLLGFAQPTMEEIALKYPFLDTAQNRFQYLGTRSGMEQFYGKLDQLLLDFEGKINIVHIGGSHVQGGTLSHTMRQHLSQLAPGIGVERGFFFPHSLANTNMPHNILVNKKGEWEGCRNSITRNNCHWGVSGINATTRDLQSGFSLQSFKDDQTVYEFTELRIFEDLAHNTLRPVVHPVPDSTAIDLVAGVRRLFFNMPQSRIELKFEWRDSVASGLEPLYTLQGVQMVYSSDEPALVYHALGVNGASTKSFLRSENFVAQGNYLAPDLVIFGLGINDAYMAESAWKPEEYEARYDTLVQWFREINQECQFIFMTNNDSYYHRRRPNKNALDVVEVMKRLSAKYDAVCWDLFGVMGGLNSISLWEDMGLAKPDKIHFTKAGYQLNSDLLFWALWADYERHLKTLPSW